MKRIIILIISISLCLTGCGTAKKPYSASGFCFDTIITCNFYGKNAVKAAKDCMALGNHYDDLWNKNKPDSEIYKLNHSLGNHVKVSDETVEVLKLAVDIAKRSNGMVTPLIGSLSSLWNFKDESPSLPLEEDIKEALKHTDYTNIHISGTEVWISDPEAKLDLGFIAKGYAADKMKELALKDGVTSGYINLGGNVLTIGSKPGNADFNIGIRDPSSEASSLFSVPIRDLSVVTSGVYERCFTIDDTLYFHILDTKTGYPVRNNLLSVSVIGPSSAMCDALSTTLFVMGYDTGVAFLKDFPDYKAIFITDDGEILKTY